MSKLLLIDDDAELCELVSEYLAGEGFDIEVSNDGQRGLEQALSGDHDLVILDVMLPALNGFEVLRKLRDGSGVPVVMLTARGEDVDRIVGLEMGADDYLSKPFNPRELAARIRAILRRSERDDSGQAEVLSVAGLRLDCAARELRFKDQLIELTSVEFQMLEILLRSAGQVVTRDELSRAALGRRASSLDRSLDVHLSNIRRKLAESGADPDRIKTVRGVGYLFARPSAGSA